MDNLFNLSMTYMLSSDAPYHYGEYQELTSSMDQIAWENMTSIWFHSKARDVAWTVSHCQTGSRREDYVKVLNRSIHIDIYGSCPEYSPIAKPRHEEFYKLVKSEYKMYLAFENKFCQDSITEKM